MRKHCLNQLSFCCVTFHLTLPDLEQPLAAVYTQQLADLPSADDALTPAERAATLGWLRDARIWALVKQNVRARACAVFVSLI